MSELYVVHNKIPLYIVPYILLGRSIGRNQTEVESTYVHGLDHKCRTEVKNRHHIMCNDGHGQQHNKIINYMRYRVPLLLPIVFYNLNWYLHY